MTGLVAICGFELSVLAPLVGGMLLGVAIGLERDTKDKAARLLLIC